MVCAPDPPKFTVLALVAKSNAPDPENGEVFVSKMVDPAP